MDPDQTASGFIVFGSVKIHSRCKKQTYDGIWVNMMSNLRAKVMQFKQLHYDFIELLPLSEGDLMICSPETGNIVRGGMSPSLKGNNCFITLNHF